VTSWPSRALVVVAASAAIVVQHSKVGSIFVFGTVWKWS
jgi:hypothetical protein